MTNLPESYMASWGSNYWPLNWNLITKLKLGIHMRIRKISNQNINKEGILIYGCMCVYAWYSNTPKSYAARSMTYPQTRIWIPSLSQPHYRAQQKNSNWMCSWLGHTKVIDLLSVGAQIYKGIVWNYGTTVMILSFRTGRSGQTVQTQIRLLLEEQSDQGLHCLPFHQHHLDSLL